MKLILEYQLLFFLNLNLYRNALKHFNIKGKIKTIGYSTLDRATRRRSNEKDIGQAFITL